MVKLETYRRKRDFDRTPEPAGGRQRPARRGGGIFVVHKHAARRLHFDLRLERGGVLESWAVPKGPGFRPGDKRLAVHVEDHPLDYGDFEGVIPEGEYGGGTVMLWDRGRWKPGKREAGRIDFVLDGHKLRGAWTLTRMRGRADERGENWLLIKRRDERPAVKPDARAMDRSVATGRTMKEIATDRSREWTPHGESEPAEPLPDLGRISGSRRRALPRAPRPELATLVDRAPEEEGWIHEIKLDGYRILARKDGRRVTLFSRNGKDWTSRFPELAERLKSLPAPRALLDGEVVLFEKGGTTSFRGLQEALSAARTEDLVYQAFDVLYVDGFDLSRVALRERKRVLHALCDAAGFVGRASVRYGDHVEGDGHAFYERACRLGLEGIVSKRASSPYREGRARDWLKVKCSRHEELVVGGYTDPRGSRSGFGALLLGAWQGERLVYAGKVGTGFRDRDLRTLRERLDELQAGKCPFDPPPAERRARWVRPELVAEVEFTEWTRDGRLRHPSFRGLREDKNVDEIRLPNSDDETKARGRRASVPKENGSAVAGVILTHPERILYPEQGVTKIVLARFYEEIASWLLPGLVHRPLSLVRCPEGHRQECFFQKHPREATAKRVPRVEIREKSGTAAYLYVASIADVVALVQVGALELHVWGCRIEDVELPDQLVFDLDPATDVRWGEVLRTARELRDRLQELSLASFVRTTGGKGLHVVVPLEPALDWDAVKEFARAVAESHARDDPRRLTTNMSKAKRPGKVFLDYLRNGRGATAIASYSTRARDGAPVATPLRWDELGTRTKSDRFGVPNLRRRLSSLRGDPWEGFDEARRPLTRAMLDRVRPRSGGKR